MVLTALRTAEAVDVVLTALGRTPEPGSGPRIVAVDGRSGVGKTDLADAVATRLGCPVVHMDDLYPGWDGLAAAVDVLRTQVVEPLRAGGSAVYRRYDWAAGGPGGQVRVPDSPVVVLEGVGAGAAADVDLLLWLDAGRDVRRRRGLARDGAMFLPHWDRWAAQEDALFTAHPVAARADLTFGTGAEAPDGPLWELRP